MCSDESEGSVKVPDDELARVRELRTIAVDALVEANQILAKLMNVDPDSVTSVTIGLRRKAGVAFDDAVPPVWQDPCVQYNAGGACAYLECDPPGETRPCIPTTLPS
jgi:hypothetical protein